MDNFYSMAKELLQHFMGKESEISDRLRIVGAILRLLPPQMCMLKPQPRVMASKSQAFGRCIRHGIMPSCTGLTFFKESWGDFLPFHYVETQLESTSVEAQSKPVQSCDCWLLDLASSVLQDYNPCQLLTNDLVSSILSEQAKETETMDCNLLPCLSQSMVYTMTNRKL